MHARFAAAAAELALHNGEARLSGRAVRLDAGTVLRATACWQASHGALATSRSCCCWAHANGAQLPTVGRWHTERSVGQALPDTAPDHRSPCGCQPSMMIFHTRVLTASGSHHWQLPTWQAEHAKKSLLQSTLAQFRWGSAAGCPQAQGTAAGSSPETSCCPASKSDGACSPAQGYMQGFMSMRRGAGLRTDRHPAKAHLQVHRSRLWHTICCPEQRTGSRGLPQCCCQHSSSGL